MNDEPDYRMDPSLGVIRWQNAIVVYRMEGETIAWARALGGPFLQIDDALRAAIRDDRAPNQRSSDR